MEPFVGQIQAFGFNFAPRGWCPCDGRQLPISQWTAVFSLLGTTYGGNGQTTFAVPDLRGRAMVNQGQGPGLSLYQLGQTVGHESTTLNTNQMPQHTHQAASSPHTHTATATSTLYAESDPGAFANPIGRMLATVGNMYADPDPGNNRAMGPDSVQTTVAVDAATAGVTIGIAGGSQAFDNRSPMLCVNICIALEGIFPPRN
jgi:microcystin-dependent protein